MPYHPDELWAFLPQGYLETILWEAPILLLLLSRPHPWWRRLLCGLWLTAFSYPIVILVLPLLIANHDTYLWVAETFAPASEIALFGLAFWTPKVTRWQRVQDAIAIIIANLASFLIGLYWTQIRELFT
jgi:hypothetical protein